MLNPKQFRIEIIRPTLEHMGMWSQAAENLEIGTGYQESRLTYLRQLGGGPALGIYQIEPDTHTDLWMNYLAFRKPIADKLRQLRSKIPLGESNLITNLAYATAVCRLLYYRQAESLPDAQDIEGLAAYWKKYYNTPDGAGTVTEWVFNYREMESMT